PADPCFIRNGPAGSFIVSGQHLHRAERGLKLRHCLSRVRTNAVLELEAGEGYAVACEQRALSLPRPACSAQTPHGPPRVRLNPQTGKLLDVFETGSPRDCAMGSNRLRQRMARMRAKFCSHGQM